MPYPNYLLQMPKQKNIEKHWILHIIIHKLLKAGYQLLMGNKVSNFFLPFYNHTDFFPYSPSTPTTHNKLWLQNNSRVYWVRNLIWTQEAVKFTLEHIHFERTKGHWNEKV